MNDFKRLPKNLSFCRLFSGPWLTPAADHDKGYGDLGVLRWRRQKQGSHACTQDDVSFHWACSRWLRLYVLLLLSDILQVYSELGLSPSSHRQRAHLQMALPCDGTAPFSMLG